MYVFDGAYGPVATWAGGGAGAGAGTGGGGSANAVDAGLLVAVVGSGLVNPAAGGGPTAVPVVAGTPGGVVGGVGAVAILVLMVSVDVCW